MAFSTIRTKQQQTATKTHYMARCQRRCVDTFFFMFYHCLVPHTVFQLLFLNVFVWCSDFNQNVETSWQCTKTHFFKVHMATVIHIDVNHSKRSTAPEFVLTVPNTATVDKKWKVPSIHRQQRQPYFKNLIHPFKCQPWELPYIATQKWWRKKTTWYWLLSTFRAYFSFYVWP